jgi:hypothetical protein
MGIYYVGAEVVYHTLPTTAEFEYLDIIAKEVDHYNWLRSAKIGSIGYIASIALNADGEVFLLSIKWRDYQHEFLFTELPSFISLLPPKHRYLRILDYS